MRTLLATLVVVTALAATVAPAHADSAFVGYDDEQVTTLYRAAGYLDKSPETYALDSLGVHHFLLGISQKLEDPTGGCDLGLEALVDKTNGPHYFLVEDIPQASLDAVGQYYCLSAQAALEVSVTLLVFLVFANANLLGIPVPGIDPLPTSARPTGFPGPSRHVTFDPGGAISDDPLFITSMIQDSDEQMLFFRSVRSDVGCAFGVFNHPDGTDQLRVELLPNGCADSAALANPLNHIAYSEGQMVELRSKLGSFLGGLQPNDATTVQWNVDGPDGGFVGNTDAAPLRPFDTTGVYRVVPPGSEKIYGVPTRLTDMVDVPQAVTPPGTCVAGAGEVCSGNDRFRVSVDWDYPMDPSGMALDGSDGAFFFFTPTGQQLLVQTLDRCHINDHFWVFASALTDVEFTVTVVDTATGTTNSFGNTPAAFGEPVVDTTAFATCP